MFPTEPGCPDTRGPNFFIVGAAKAGTTALHEGLGQHPDVYMSPVKETYHFSPDPGLPYLPYASRSKYLALFAGGEACKVRGESTPGYLYSPQAALRIHEFCSQARILIVLRNPVEVCQSLYAESRKWGIEPKASLESALAASDRGRPRLEKRPGGAWLRYRDVLRYSEQVERYLRAFPPEQLYVGLHEDMVRDPAAFCTSILRFLGVDPNVPVQLPRVNEKQSFRSSTLQRLYMRPYAKGLPADAPRSFPYFWRLLLRLNMSSVSPSPLPRAVRQTLIEDLRADVERLGGMIERDLSPWLMS